MKIRLLHTILTTGLFLAATGCGGSGSTGNCFELDAYARGCSEETNGIVNVSVISHDQDVLRAEYRAGFVQGRLQGQKITAARDNLWDSAYLVDPSHSFPSALPVPDNELDRAARLLLENFNYTLNYQAAVPDPLIAERMMTSSLRTTRGTAISIIAALFPCT